MDRRPVAYSSTLRATGMACLDTVPEAWLLGPTGSYWAFHSDRLPSATAATECAVAVLPRLTPDTPRLFMPLDRLNSPVKRPADSIGQDEGSGLTSVKPIQPSWRVTDSIEV